MEKGGNAQAFRKPCIAICESPVSIQRDTYMYKHMNRYNRQAERHDNHPRTHAPTHTYCEWVCVMFLIAHDAHVPTYCNIWAQVIISTISLPAVAFYSARPALVLHVGRSTCVCVCVCCVCLSVCLWMKEWMDQWWMTRRCLYLCCMNVALAAAVYTHTHTRAHFMLSFYIFISFRLVSKTQEHRYRSFRRIWFLKNTYLANTRILHRPQRHRAAATAVLLQRDTQHKQQCQQCSALVPCRGWRVVGRIHARNTAWRAGVRKSCRSEGQVSTVTWRQS
jgi:hypothetical protein